MLRLMSGQEEVQGKGRWQKPVSRKLLSRMFGRSRSSRGDVYEVKLSSGKTIYTTSLTDKRALEAAMKTAQEANELAADLSSAKSS